MKNKQYHIVNGNQAAARIAYRINEVCAIYPITPSSEMSELVEEWSANQQKNIFGDVPVAYEMQSEAGVAGAMHGALQTGALTTTFTASQGLLLMMPNMYKIAGELTPNVIHVATRSVATHALSVFGDHSDIMAVRSTGYAFLGSSSVQEAADFALIAQTASLASRIPFVHFFDGFRTSHETSKIEKINDYVLKEMIDLKYITAHRNRALNPNNPCVRGTAQGPDVFFQTREASNSYYEACPDIVQDQMDRFTKLTGRQYRIMEYMGHPKAEQVIIAMASATETLAETIAYLNAHGEKVGLVKVRLFRPFSTKHLIQSIPSTCRTIAVLDRTKEPGSVGEPLYLDVVQSVLQTSDTGKFDVLPKIVGGRYGLASKEFTPNMVKAILDNLKNARPKNNFTVGIHDDISGFSLNCSEPLEIMDESRQLLFFETKSAQTQTKFNALLQRIGKDSFVQGYMECDYKKSNARGVSHIRISDSPIKAPYLVSNADFIGCDSIDFLRKETVLQKLKTSGILVIHSEKKPKDFWQNLSAKEQKIIQAKSIRLYVVNLHQIPEKHSFNDFTISALHACYLHLSQDIVGGMVYRKLPKYLRSVKTIQITSTHEQPLVLDTNFSESLLGKLLAGKGGELPVSAMPEDGTFATDTSRYQTPKTVREIPQWNDELCIQCGACSMACPQGAIRTKAYDYQMSLDVPPDFKSVVFAEEIVGFGLLNYTVQVNPDQCTSCNNCVDACPVKALSMVSGMSRVEYERENWKYFESIPEFDRTKIDSMNVAQQQLQEPLFKYSTGVDGCGEAPYLKLLSQLFGDRMLVANATGSSSIFGGALPTTPWSKNQEGRGPAWSNSLFEDNAEFGLGYRLSLNHQEMRAKHLLEKLGNGLDNKLVMETLNADQTSELDIDMQRDRVERLKVQLSSSDQPEATQLLDVIDNLVKKSIWIVGGDGWAYDIGYGGLDHVLASGENVNILVLDNEVYSNTGGQNSKATPFGATAKFASQGKKRQKKDLGAMALLYDDVYVASVAIGADQEQTLKAFVEAEQYNGPSLIIAYCHSPAHGIDMRQPSQYHKAAVASGQWLLYRNDPRRAMEGFNSMQLDSDKPSLPIADYLAMEKRFNHILKDKKGTSHNYSEDAQKLVDKRYHAYKRLAYSAVKPFAEFSRN